MLTLRNRQLNIQRSISDYFATHYNYNGNLRQIVGGKIAASSLENIYLTGYWWSLYENWLLFATIQMWLNTCVDGIVLAQRTV